MSLTLDCENGDTATSSLASIFNCSPARLRNLMQAIDMDAIYDGGKNSPRIEPREYLLNYIINNTGTPAQTNGVCWFHLTRTIRSCTFKQGILPLSASLDIVWEMLLNLFNDPATKNNLLFLRQHGVPDFQYQLKYKEPLHAGPYGILVRDVAFNPEELYQHNYLEIPEIVEDICNGYERNFHIHLHDLVNDALSPCIIKFKSPKSARIEEIGAALSYVYTYSNHLAVCGNSVICYDGENTPVHPTQIVKIDFLD